MKQTHPIIKLQEDLRLHGAVLTFPDSPMHKRAMQLSSSMPLVITLEKRGIEDYVAFVKIQTMKQKGTK